MFHIISKWVDECWFSTAGLSQKKNILCFSINSFFLFWLILVFLDKKLYNFVNVWFFNLFFFHIKFFDDGFFKFFSVIDMIFRKNFQVLIIYRQIYTFKSGIMIFAFHEEFQMQHHMSHRFVWFATGILRILN